MVRARKQAEKILSQAEIKTIQEEKQELENNLRESEASGVGTQAEQIDRGAIKAQISHLNHYLDQMRPGKLTGAQKDALAERERELEAHFEKGLPSRYEMDHPAKCPGAVRKHMSWDKKNKGLAVEYRNLQRLLRPGEERSIEQLRKDGHRSKYI